MAGTAETLTDVNWERFLEVCDKVSDEGENGCVPFFVFTLSIAQAGGVSFGVEARELRRGRLAELGADDQLLPGWTSAW